MAFTYRDGISTLAAVGAVVVERAYFHNWNLPLVDNILWVIVAIALLGYVCFRFAYVLDSDQSSGWSVFALVATLGAAGIAALGAATNNPDFVTLLTLNIVFFWLGSIIQHARVPAEHARQHDNPPKQHAM